MALSLCLAPILRKFLPVNRGDFQADSRRLGHRLFDERPGEGLVSVFLAEPRDPDLADVSLRLVEREVGEVVQDAPLTEGRLRLRLGDFPGTPRLLPAVKLIPLPLHLIESEVAQVEIGGPPGGPLHNGHELPIGGTGRLSCVGTVPSCTDMLVWG